MERFDPETEEKIRKELEEWEAKKRAELKEEKPKKEKEELEKRKRENSKWLAKVELAAAKLKECVPTAIANEENLKLREGFDLQRVDVAKGKYAKIYKAVDKNGTEMFAKLVIMTGMKKKTQDSLREAYKCLKYMKNNSHENLMKVFDVFCTKEKAYIFIEKLNLIKVKSGGAADEATAQKWAKNVAAGLEFLHVNGIAHNHLLPENILIDNNGVVKIAGFLSASIAFDPLSKNFIKQEPLNEYYPHHSPERIKQKFDGIKADVFAFGVLICYFLTRQFPFALAGRDKSKHPLSVQWKLCLKRKIKMIPTELKMFLTEVFESDPDKRPHIRLLAKRGWMQQEITPAAPPPIQESAAVASATPVDGTPVTSPEASDTEPQPSPDSKKDV